jgi:SAM-dependent methyltransferase
MSAPDAYREELEKQARTWERKPALRALYRHWFAQIAARLAPGGPSIELGCGCGALGQELGSVIRTDNVLTPWCDMVADGKRLPIRSGALGNVLFMDVIHHIARPLDVLAECQRVLRPGGRVVLLEPAISLFGRFVYGVLHHEGVDMSYDVQRPGKDDALFANGGIPTLLFGDRSPRGQGAAAGSGAARLGSAPDVWRSAAPELHLVERTALTGPSYLLTGGFSYPGLLPAFAVQPLQRLEDRLVRGRLDRWLALRMLVVLERRAAAPIATVP